MKKPMAKLTKREADIYSNEFAHYLNNVRNDSERADRHAWRETVKASPRLAKYAGGLP